MIHRLHDQMIDSVTGCNLYILNVMWYYTLLFTNHKAELTEYYMQTLTVHIHAHASTKLVGHNTYNRYTIKALVRC